MTWLLPIAQSILSAQQNSQAERAQRRDAQAQIWQNQASQMGYPTASLGAQQFNKGMEEQYGARNPLAALIPLLMSRGGK